MLHYPVVLERSRVPRDISRRKGDIRIGCFVSDHQIMKTWDLQELQCVKMYFNIEPLNVRGNKHKRVRLRQSSAQRTCGWY
jgi:hypothetical protein